MDNFRGGDDGFGGEVGPIQVLHNPLAYRLRRALPGGNGSQGTVWMIRVGIKRGDIHPGNVGDFLQEPVFGPVLPLRLLVQGDNLHGDLFPLAQGKEIHKVCQRFWVEGTNATGKYQVPQSLPVPAVDRDLRQAKHVDHIGVAHLIADGKGDHVKVPDRVLAL